MPEIRLLIRKTEHTGLTVASIDESPECRGLDDRTALVYRPCDGRTAHVAFAVDDMDTVPSRVEPAGWIRQGTPRRMPCGTVAVYVRGSDGHMVELMQPPAA